MEGASKAGSLPKLGIDLSRLKNVRIMPSTPDPRTFYAVTKLLLMPSLIESAGLVAMEAMTNGIPVLGSNRGGLPETIGDAGFLFDLPARYTPQTRRADGRGGRVVGRDDHPPLGRRRVLRTVQHAARERAQTWHPERLRRYIATFLAALSNGATASRIHDR